MDAERRRNLEIVKVHGVRLPIDPSVMSENMQDIIRRGLYETNEASRLVEVIEPGERVLELGGGIGYLSTVIGRQTSVESITVYEASPDFVPLIELTHEMNGVAATVHNAAVMARKTADTVSFYIRQDFWGSSLVSQKKRKAITGVVDVPVVGLDTLLREHAPTMLVIDVEGSEVELLEGVDLSGVRKVLIEVHFKIVGPHGFKAVFDTLSGQGFHYDPRHSRGQVILFRRIEDA